MIWTCSTVSCIQHFLLNVSYKVTNETWAYKQHMTIIHSARGLERKRERERERERMGEIHLSNIPTLTKFIAMT